MIGDIKIQWNPGFKAKTPYILSAFKKLNNYKSLSFCVLSKLWIILDIFRTANSTMKDKMENKNTQKIPHTLIEQKD